MDDKLLKRLNTFISEIDQEYKLKIAYLFGSFSRGEENEKSDIDLALLFEKKYTDFQDAMLRGALIERGKEVLGREVDIVNLNIAPIRLKYQVVKEGQILKDHFIRPSFESLVLREYFDYMYYAEKYNQAIIESIKENKYFGGK